MSTFSQMTERIVLLLATLLAAVYGQSNVCEEELVIANGRTIAVTSPGYPDPYPDSSFCLWRIRTTSQGRDILVSFDDLDTDLCGIVEVGVGPPFSRVTYIVTGDEEPADFTSSFPLVWIHFRSNCFQNSRRGFKISLTSVDKGRSGYE
ncbi:low-density lipoprotein receptor-related protein 12-like [Saccoglossus kowalevskii]